MSLYDELIMLKEFLTPDRWCTGSFAHDTLGLPVPYWDRSAVSWCMEGACLNLNLSPGAFDVLANFAYSEYGLSVPLVNDTHGYEAVVGLIDSALASLSSPPTESQEN